MCPVFCVLEMLENSGMVHKILQMQLNFTFHKILPRTLRDEASMLLLGEGSEAKEPYNKYAKYFSAK